MLQKRVDFALRQIRETGRLGSFPVRVTVDSDSLNAFLEVLSQNFQSNDRLLALIENLAGGNMRLALRFVTDFIGSGHVNTKKILDCYGETGRYTIAVHEFLRAIMFGDAEYYDPESSPIANLLRVTRPDGREHFLLPLLLSQLQVLGERFGQEGYVRAEELYSFAQGLGFDDDQVSASLRHATSNRLMEASPRYVESATSLSYRITTVGAYTTRTLLGYFAYLDAVCVDTPILDPAYARLISDAKSLTERVSRADYFRIYLDKQWTRIVANSLPWDWPTTSATAAGDIRRVGNVADPGAWSHAPRP